ncbi:MAG: sulfatase-like hydrolase/transferase [Thermoanaerobaculia bacterium]
MPLDAARSPLHADRAGRPPPRRQPPSRAPRALALPELLRGAGYRTVAITGGGYLDPQFGLAQGFDSYRYYPERAGEELDRNLRRLRLVGCRTPRSGSSSSTATSHTSPTIREPFLDRLVGGPSENLDDLAYVTSGLDLEHSFVLSKRWRLKGTDGADRELSADELQRLTDLYDSGLAYTDDKVSELLRAADSVGEPMTVVTSDHGEALGEHGLAGHAYLWDVNALVPLVVKRPHRKGPLRVATQVRTTDIAPTLLELAGLPPPAGIDGLSLVPLLDGAEGQDREATVYSSFSNRGLALRLGRDTKVLFDNTAWGSLWGRRALYEPATDPGELGNGESQQVPELLAQRLLSLAAGIRGAVRIEISNTAAPDLAGSLQGPALQPARLSSSLLPEGALQWESPRRVLLHVSIGDSCILFLENPPGAALRLELAPDLDLQLDLDALDGGVHRWLADGTWSEERPAAPSAAVEIGWTALQSATIDPGEEDAELREQLRALGYLD